MLTERKGMSLRVLAEMKGSLLCAAYVCDRQIEGRACSCPRKGAAWGGYEAPREVSRPIPFTLDPRARVPPLQVSPLFLCAERPQVKGGVLTKGEGALVAAGHGRGSRGGGVTAGF